MSRPPNLRCAARILAIAFLLTAGAGCAHQRQAAPLQRHEYAQLHMGVRTRLVVYAATTGQADAAARAAYARVAELEQVASDYRPTSELMQLCRNAGQGPVKVSPELFTLLSFAQELARRTDGAFDVTVGPYVQLWRGARKSQQLPDPDQLDAARRLVGWRHVHLDPRHRTVALALPGMRLDLGGIAKGYAGDEAIRVMKKHGICSALFEAGGDIVVSGPPPGKKGWDVEIVDAGSASKRVVQLARCGISTSGDTEQFVEIDGKRYSHVVDPRTGIGLTHRYAATVIAPNGITSDALSTAATVLGAEEGTKLVKSYRGAKAYIRRVN
jgi:thiamine biosynthesis lipoprotein